jgi:hypothetical protein
MTITDLYAHRVNVAQTTQDVLGLIDSRSVGIWGNKLLGEVLTGLLASTFTKPTGFEELVISESIASAAAAHIGPQVQTWLALHQWLVENGFTHGNDWLLDFPERYVCAMADEESFKSLVMRTQSQTFMIAIEICEGFEDGADGQTVKVQKLGIDIRMCQNPSLQRSSHLGFMLSKATALRSPYFNLKDASDKGYIISVRPEILGKGWVAGAVAPDWQILGYVIREINSLVVSSTLA